MTMKWHQHVISYIPAVLIALILGIGLAWTQYSNRHQAPTETVAQDFHPITAKQLVFMTKGPYTVGQTVTLQNGVCNNTKDTLQATTVVGFIETNVDRLLARNIVIRPNPTTGEGTLPRPLVPGCTGADPVTGPLPASLPAGHWQLYIIINVMGSQAGQMQRLNLVSDTIEVNSAPAIPNR